MTIVKEADHVVKDARSTSRRTQAGYDAEREMAFYLRRAFADDARVHIFHDLRLVRGEEVAQIDHLLLHRHGAFIVESKSISGEIEIRSDGQFIRKRGRSREGMQSPVEQARMQGDQMRKLLIDHKTELRGKAIFGLQQKGFLHMPIEIFVAISDCGIIEGAKHAPAVMKADQICNAIRARLDAHAKGASIIGLLSESNDGIWSMTQEEFKRVSEFLFARHTPRRQGDGSNEKAKTSTVQPPAPISANSSATSMSSVAVPIQAEALIPKIPARVSPVAADAPAIRPPSDRPTRNYLCSKCHSINVFITYGKFGYYLKCRECDGNTPIDLTIERTGKKGRIRKEGPRFFLVDQDSGAEELIFINPETP